MNPETGGPGIEETGLSPWAALRRGCGKLLKTVTGVSLFLKVMGIALFLIALFGAQTIVETRALMTDYLKKESAERSALLVRQLESSLIDRLITGDLVTVSGILAEAEEIYPEVVYAFVLNPQGRVQVGTQEFRLSQVLVDANAFNRDGSIGSELFETEFGTINDLAAPIMGGRLGTLRIGISQEYREQAVNAMTARLMRSFFLVALIGMLISYLLALVLTRHFKNLMEGIDLVEKGNLDVRVRPWFNDEIGRLTDAFNNMAGALARKRALKMELVRKLLTSQEDERLRISRELHDKTAQSLTSIKIGLKVLEKQVLPREALVKFGEFRELLNSSLDEIHELAVELRPPALGDLGLPQVVRELGENFKRTFGIEVNCVIEGYFLENRLAAELEIGLYRIIQEAFSNIEKHSGADLVTVGLSKTQGRIELTIRDNGRGFDQSQVLAKPDRKPIGLAGMTERAEIFGGKLALSSIEGSGTEIKISIPVTA